MANDPLPPTKEALTPNLPSTTDERSMAMWSHILGGIISWLGPLIIYLTKKDSPFVEDQSKEALNFQLTMLIPHVIGTLPCGLGLLLTVPFALIFGIVGGLAANKGEVYRYPLNIRFIK